MNKKKKYIDYQTHLIFIFYQRKKKLKEKEV